MPKDTFRNEKLYQTTMHIARKMLADRIISEEEYRRIDEIFLENTILFSARYSRIYC